MLFQSTQRKLELVVLMEKNWLFMFWKKWHFVPLLSHFSAMTFEGLAICMLKFMHRIGLVRTFSKLEYTKPSLPAEFQCIKIRFKSTWKNNLNFSSMATDIMCSQIPRLWFWEIFALVPLCIRTSAGKQSSACMMCVCCVLLVSCASNTPVKEGGYSISEEEGAPYQREERYRK